MAETRKIAAILAADVVGFSRLTGADEDRTLARLRALRSDLIDPTIAVHNGRVVKRTGDGALVEFRSVVEAVRCAIEVQNGMVERNAGLAPERRIDFRIGIHLGDIVEESDGDLMGDGVNIAARLEGIAKPGTICLSEDAYRQVKARLNLAVSDLGATQLKNIADPIRVYALEVGIYAEGKPVTPGGLATQPPAEPAMLDNPSIAVLAFNNMSGDPEQEYFSDGISEDIITDLSKLSELHVIARNSTFTYKGKPVDVKQVGRDLGVRYVLEGSVRKAGNRVRVTGQLIDATSGAHIWADRFDRDLTDIFAVQDELTQVIISALKVKLTPEKKGRLVRKNTIDQATYDLFLRGRELAWLNTRSGNIEARNLLGHAILINPDFGAAHAFIGFTHVNDYVNGWVEVPEQSLDTGLEVAMRAVQLDEADHQGHYVLAVAFFFHREHDRALTEARRSVALAPNFAQGHHTIARVLTFSGDPAGAINRLDAYMKLDPLYPDMALHVLAEARFSLGQFVEAVAALKQRLGRSPDSATSLALLASCYGHLGRIAEARAAWAEVRRIAPSFSIERQRRVLPYKNPDDFELRIEGMRKAGLPI